MAPFFWRLGATLKFACALTTSSVAKPKRPCAHRPLDVPLPSTDIKRPIAQINMKNFLLAVNDVSNQLNLDSKSAPSYIQNNVFSKSMGRGMEGIFLILVVSAHTR